MWYYESRIRIEPDWNVKAMNLAAGTASDLIRIEPDWNVKVAFTPFTCISFPLE